MRDLLANTCHSSSLPSLLIVSWDSEVRSVSEPFAWGELLIQLYKEKHPELFVDYIDLHQDAVIIPLDIELKERFDAAQLVCVIINEAVSSDIEAVLMVMHNYPWSSATKCYCISKKDQPIFADWSLIESKKSLTKELASL